MSLQASHFLHPIQSFPSPKTNGITKADNFITCRRNLVNPKMFFVSMSIDPRKTSITTSVSTSRTLILRSREQMNCLFTVLFTWVVTWLTVPFRGRLRLRGVKNVNFSVKSSSVVASYSVDKAKIGGGRREVGEDERRKMAIRRLEEGNDGNSERDFSLLVMEKGRTIFTQSWRSLFTKTKGLVVLLHGLNEHSGRYNDFAKKLNANGYKVYGMDWIGHGGSDGLHAYVHCLDDAVADMKAFLQEVIAESPGLPCFCFGHSTGAAIILKAVMNPDVEAHVAGIVVTSPAVRVQPSHPLVPVIAPFVSLLLPKHQLRAGNKKRVLVSRDPEALVAKYSDPLVYTGSIRARTGYEILRVTYYLQQNLKRLRVPFLVLHGSADTITDPKASVELYEEASSADKTIKVYDGFYHDLLFEPERDSIMRDIIEWLNCRLKSLADSK